MVNRKDAGATCTCAERPDWAVIDDDAIMRWPAIDIGEWEELRQCPECERTWLAAWPEEGEGPPILCRVRPAGTRKLRDLDHASTMRQYCLARLAEHLGGDQGKQGQLPKGQLRPEASGRKHLLRRAPHRREFGRYLAHLDEATPTPAPTTQIK